MKIVRRRSDNHVVYITDKDAQLTDKLLAIGNMKAHDISLSTHEIVTVNEIPDYVTPGQYQYDGEWVHSDSGDLDKAKENAKDKLASLRFIKETAGITINGHNIATDRESQILITNLAIRAKEDNSFSIKFKSKRGRVVNAGSAVVIAIYNAVFNYVQACRENEAQIIELIDACSTHTELKNIDLTVGWPSDEIKKANI